MFAYCISKCNAQTVLLNIEMILIWKEQNLTISFELYTVYCTLYNNLYM